MVAACAGAARPCSDDLRDRPGRAHPGRPAGRGDRRRVQRPPAPYRRRPDACSARTPSTPRVAAFGRRGVDVLARPSPWRLGPEQADLTAEWFTGWLDAAVRAAAGAGRPGRAYRGAGWREAAAGRLTVLGGPRRPPGRVDRWTRSRPRRHVSRTRCPTGRPAPGGAGAPVGVGLGPRARRAWACSPSWCGRWAAARSSPGCD